MKKEIFGLTPEELQQEFVAAGLKKFRASQVYQWLYKKCVFKFEEMHNLSKADIAVLNEKFTVMPANINILTRWKSSDGLTEKLLLYGGAIQLAGSVKGKATARHAWKLF